MSQTTQRDVVANATSRARSSRFETAEHDAFAALQNVATELDQQVARLLKPAGITPPKYYVLRILRRAGTTGLRCSEISSQLIRHDPDVTRLLDRLEEDGLVTRSRDTDDRRIVIARITAAGLALLEKLDQPITALHEGQFSTLTAEERSELVSLLGRIARPGG